MLVIEIVLHHTSTTFPPCPFQGKVLTDLEEARRAAGEVQTETTWTRQELTALSEKRREEESALVGARQRATALAREEASLRAVAATARREGAEGRDAAAAARNELTELLEAVDRERRVLEGFRDQAAVLEANLARKKEEDRFAREAADAQQLRLDEIKREVESRDHIACVKEGNAAKYGFYSNVDRATVLTLY